MNDATKCVICRRRTLRDDETMACRRCCERLDETLSEILERYALLPLIATPGSVMLDDMPHGRQVDAPAPVRLEVVDLMDGRLVDDVERRGVLGIVGAWARLVREERSLTDPDFEITVASEIGLLRDHLAWITTQPWVDEMAAELRDLRRELLATWGDSGSKPIGACPAEVIENGRVETCGEPLYAPLYGDVVQCRICRASWTKEKWLILGAAIQEGA